MSVIPGDLTMGLHGAGVERGDHILVHASLSSLGWVEGGAEAMIAALLDAVGGNGTVVFATLTGTPEDSPERPPAFDAAKSACWTGMIPEAARARPDAVRSLHPTHSVAAIGRLARWITSEHELVRTPCGFGSPYDKLADIGGKIVLIGVDQSANTSFHHAEELAGAPYVLQDEPADIVMKDLQGRKVAMRSTYLHLWGPRRDFNALEDAMIQLGICRIGRVGDAAVRVIDAVFQRVFLLGKLLDDPLATLALGEREAWQGKTRIDLP